jgi:POT family proton-dependent oligopeptide transporter
MNMAPVPKPSADRWPPQIKYIVGNEAVERFSYYGIRSILAGYITAAALNNARGGLGMEKDSATEIIHMFTSANYLMPLLGAWFADKIAGRYNTIFYVSMIYCVGNLVLAASGFAGSVHAKMVCLCAGLGLIAFGSGGIKPCVSAFMGDQFRAEQSHLLQKAYGAFYWAINFGSFFAFLVIPWVKNEWNYGIAFGVPGILMAVATLIFWLGTKYYVRKPTNRETHHAGFFTVFLSAWRGSQTTPWLALLNVLATIGLPVAAMALMLWLGFSGKSEWHKLVHLPFAAEGSFYELTFVRLLGWGAFVCAVSWYILVIAFSLLRKTELPESFLRQAAARHPERDIASARSLSPILFIFAFVPVFWALFDQTNSTWVMQGNQMLKFHPGQLFVIRWLFPYWDYVSIATGYVLLLLLIHQIYRKRAALQKTTQHVLIAAAAIVSSLFTWFMFWLPDMEIGAEEMQSANPLIVMGLVPLMTLLIYPRLGKLASPLRRMSSGMFVAGASYLVVAALQKHIDAGAHLCVLWQFVPYFILTTAEVLVSTTGLEFAFREAAPEMKSAIMSFWLLTVTMGDLLVVTVTRLFSSSGGHGADSVSAGRFLQYAGMMFLVAVLFSIVAAFYQYHDKAAAEGK